MKKVGLLAASLMLTSTAFASEAELKQEIEVLKQQLDAIASQVESSSANSHLSKLTIGGYGEHHLNIKKDDDNQIDAHRFVMFTGYKFSDKISLQTELEVEHSLAGDGKPGEVELEQAYINIKTTPNTDLKIGQFLIPIGIMNAQHEPDNFYGVERPVLNSKIIPTTWWEAGLMFSGQLGQNAKYNLAMHSGLDVSGDGTDLKSIRSGRQKNAEAVANHPAFTAGIEYSPMAGAKVGATLNYQHDITQGAQDISGLLAEVHGTLNKGNFGLKGVYAHWDVDTDDDAYEKQSGYYIEPSYKVTPKLGLFARYSDLEYAKGSGSQVEAKYTTVGANYWLHKNVVLKVDYQDESEADDKSINLGVGWSF